MGLEKWSILFKIVSSFTHCVWSNPMKEPKNLNLAGLNSSLASDTSTCSGFRLSSIIATAVFFQGVSFLGGSHGTGSQSTLAYLRALSLRFAVFLPLRPSSSIKVVTPDVQLNVPQRVAEQNLENN